MTNCEARLEEQQKSYVLAIPETHLIWVTGRQQPIGYVAALLSDDAWTVLSAGEGSQRPRLYEWAWFQLPEGGEFTEEGHEHCREQRGRRAADMRLILEAMLWIAHTASA